MATKILTGLLLYLSVADAIRGDSHSLRRRTTTDELPLLEVQQYHRAAKEWKGGHNKPNREGDSEEVAPAVEELDDPEAIAGMAEADSKGDAKGNTDKWGQRSKGKGDDSEEEDSEEEEVQDKQNGFSEE